MDLDDLTDRQRRELAYHRDRVRERLGEELAAPVSFEILEAPERRWWNAYWASYNLLKNLDLRGKRVLVVGCGFGHDAIRLSRLGADVYAFDLSPESISVATAIAKRHCDRIPEFRVLAAESLAYPERFFDAILAVDILHHVDIPRTMSELQRVAKPGGVLICNEVYTHRAVDWVRTNRFVDEFIHPRLVRWVYGTNHPYITPDERKLSDIDLQQVLRIFAHYEVAYFNFLVGRLVPLHWDWICRIDRGLLRMIGPVAAFLAARIVVVGRFSAFEEI
jgi:2-polyprenyl-3-methyl-5-hydroxy-6-metoxy-1,4-benzoquinol methylase